MMGTIDKALAQQIVDAIREVVDKDINFINKEGIIIASTDVKRISTFHQAGYEVAKTGKMIIVTGEESYEGTKSGVNYPIIIEQQVIGVIGITGDPKKVRKFGFLASKITEIFIREEQVATNYESRKKLMQYMMNMCIYEKGIGTKHMEEVLEKLHIAVNATYFCVVIELKKSSIDFMSIENKLITFFNKYNIELYIYNYPNQYIVFIPANRAKEFKKLSQKFKEDYIGILNSGVGQIEPILSIKQSYETALIALKYARKSKEVMVDSKSLDIELILEELSKQAKEKYIDKVIGQLAHEEIELLKNYYDHNMSLKETAGSMYVHKNTVQYRLDKINEKIGLNPRNFKHSARLYLAVYLKEMA